LTRSSIAARTTAVYRPRYPPPLRLRIWNGIVRPGLETISCGRETTDRNIEHRIA
jgi:hypothetical protein